jgi:hypothetical protein
VNLLEEEATGLVHELLVRPALDNRPAVIPAAVVAEARAFARARPAVAADLEQIDLRLLAAWPCTRRYGALLRHLLRRGAGFCRLSLPAGHDLSPVERRLLFLAIGAAMGSPLTQYGRLYAVKDRGADYRNSLAPVSMTRERTGFHTDSSARTVLPDFVGLLCERPGLAGGDSLVSSAVRVAETLMREAPEAWQLLQQDFVRDLVTPGAETSLAALQQNRFPVFAADREPAGWTFRYMRYWLERGQEKADMAVGPHVRAALDLVDELLAAPEHVVQFRLDAGEMLWVNNRTMAHDRTAFTDDPDAPRLMWRMWVGKSVVPAASAS